ncbi:MAG: helix-turn-helix domain-containing protein [Bacteroidales bacterium]|nr:helix-turn-helix domain-containing protein [Bacteroidales bacterium]
MDIASIIKSRRAKLKISQVDLAELSGVSICTIKDIERGVGNPSLSVLEKICDVLGLVINIDIRRTVD